MKKFLTLFFALLFFLVWCSASYAENLDYYDNKTERGYYAVSPNDPEFAVIDGVLFEKTTKTLLSYPYALKDDSYVIPKGIKIIGDMAFSNCDSLSKITIPDSVTSIGNDAFAGCLSLSEISIPDSVTSIGVGAFCFCDSLSKITIPDSVISIGNKAFAGCGNLTIIANKGSYAIQYAKKNNISYAYPDSLDSLND